MADFIHSTWNLPGIAIVIGVGLGAHRDNAPEKSLRTRSGGVER